MAGVLITGGIRYLQGTGFRILRNRQGGKAYHSHYLGEPYVEGMICLNRTVKFEPRPERPQNHWVDAVSRIRSLFAAGVPAILDTHRINFTGSYRRIALEQLAHLLHAVMPFQPLFLTSAELGEAVRFGGEFKDAIHGTVRKLSVRKTGTQFFSRSLLDPLSRKAEFKAAR